MSFFEGFGRVLLGIAFSYAVLKGLRLLEMPLETREKSRNRLG